MAKSGGPAASLLVVEADRLFVGVIALADNAELLDVDAGIRKLPDRDFSFVMVGEGGDD